MTVSIGLATLEPKSREGLPEFLSLAAEALGGAKHGGRNQLKSPALGISAHRSRRLSRCDAFCPHHFSAGSTRMLELGPLLKAAILGIVEGLTEFLPISSTGHLILAGELLDFNDEKGKAFLIMIQTGAMLAVMWQYRAKFIDLAIGLFTPARRADLHRQAVRRLPAGRHRRAGCSAA